MTSSKNNLDKIAVEYHGKDKLQDKHIEDAAQLHTFNWVFDQLKGSKRVLEMGYGEGHFTLELVKKGFDTTLLEGSRVLIDKVREKYGNAVKCEHSLFEEYHAGQPYDAVIATHVLEHVDDPVSLLKNMRNWVRPEGKIICIVPNAESIHRRLAVIMGLQPKLDTLSKRDELVGHQRVYSLSELKRDIETAGLETTGATGFQLKVLPNSMMLNYSAELINAFNVISAQLPPEILANIAVTAVRKKHDEESS